MKHTPSVVIDGVTYLPAGTVEAADNVILGVPETPAVQLVKDRPDLPAFVLEGGALRVRHGVTVLLGEGVHQRSIPVPMIGIDVKLQTLDIGDHLIVVSEDGVFSAVPITDPGLRGTKPIIGGFHFAPGGRADARAGGDTTPEINPHSIWDLNFRPECPDPTGMVLIDDGIVDPFWCDIYLLAQDHEEGGWPGETAGATSRYGVTIADGRSPPTGYDRLDYQVATAVLAKHGKQLLSFDEFRAATHGVTEGTALGHDPEKTGLDAPRTSRFGVMQATGNMSTWGHDGDVDGPNRACRFGGDWVSGEWAGSRYAIVDSWPDDSNQWFSARGRSDHLQLEGPAR